MAGLELGQYLFEQLQNLMDEGMDESCRILSDLFVYNCPLLEVPEFSIQKLNLLKAYGDSLFTNEQYNRAIFYYQQALDLSSNEDVHIKWSMYQCYMKLKQYQESLDILVTVPVKNRTAKITLSMAKLYHHFKKDTHTAMVYYRMVLLESPFAVEAVLALLSLGSSFSQIEIILRQHQNSLLSIKWLVLWLKIQADISNYQYIDAIKQFQSLKDQKLKISPEMNSQMGWCMAKLCQKNPAIELFKLARNADHHLLTHTDTFARLLSNNKAQPNCAQLADTLLLTSTTHIEPWVAKLWSVVRRGNWKERPLDTPSSTVLIHKVVKMMDPVNTINSEAEFLLGAISTAQLSYDDAIVHFNSSLATDPSFFDAYESVLRCYQMTRGFKISFSTMKIAIKHIKIPAQKLYLEAIVLANKPEYRSRAKFCLEAAIKEDPSFEKASISLSIIHRQEKNPSVGLKLLQQVLEVYESANIHTEAGQCLVEMRKYAEAMIFFEKALRIEPGLKGAATGLQEMEVMLQEPGNKFVDDNGIYDGSEDGSYHRRDEENQMDDSEEILILGTRESLEGVREFNGDNIAHLVDFEDDESY